MENLGTKTTGDFVDAPEWNQLATEMQNVIESAGITLSAGDLMQLTKALAHYAVNGNFYTDGGTVTTYILSPIGTNQVPTAYTNGMEVEFVAANTNTGASTINVNGLGAIPIRDSDTVGLITSGIMVRFRYDGPSNEFVLVDTSESQGNLRPGDLLPSSDPTIMFRGFIPANGLNVSRATYPALFGVLGTSFGEGNGSTTFGVPFVPPLSPQGFVQGSSFSLINTGPGIDGVANMAINYTSKDVYITSNADAEVYKSVGGTASFVSTNLSSILVANETPTGVTVDSLTGDVYVCTNRSNTLGRVYRLPGAGGSWAQYGDYNSFAGGSTTCRGIDIDERTKTLYVLDSAHGIVILPNGDTTRDYRLLIADTFFSGTAIDVAVNPLTKDVVILNSFGEIDLLENGNLPLIQIGDFPSSGYNSLAIHYTEGEIYASSNSTGRIHSTKLNSDTTKTIGDAVGVPYGVAIDQSNGEVYGSIQLNDPQLYLLGSTITSPAINWYVKT